MVLARGIEQGLRLYKEKEIIRQGHLKNLEYLKRKRSGMQVLGCLIYAKEKSHRLMEDKI